MLGNVRRFMELDVEKTRLIQSMTLREASIAHSQYIIEDAKKLGFVKYTQWQIDNAIQDIKENQEKLVDEQMRLEGLYEQIFNILQE